jgi:hypothetical protein
VDETRAPRTQTFEEVKSSLVQFLRSREVEARVKQRVSELKAQTAIVILDPKLKASVEAAPTKPAAPGQPGAKPGAAK